MALNNFVNQDVQYPNRFTIKADGLNGTVNDASLDGKVVQLDFNAGLVTQNGTPLNATEINNLVSQINSNDVQVTTNTGDIATNVSDIADNLAAINANESNITTNASDITTIKGTGWVDQTIKANADNISTNVSDIATNSTNIGTNTTNISGNATDISNIEDKTDLITITSALNLNTMSSAISTNATDINNIEDITDLISVTSAVNLNTMKTGITNNSNDIDDLQTDKVDKVVGKGLSTNDYTNTAKDKVGYISITSALNLNTMATNINTNTTNIGKKLSLSGGTMTGNISLNNTHKITNLADPTESADAANKSWVESQITTAQIGEITGNFSLLDPDGITRHKIVNIGNPTLNYDGTHKKYVDDADNLRLKLSGGTMTGPLNMNNQVINNIGTPTLNHQAVPKSYVDGGLDDKVDKVAGKTLTDNNYTDTDKTKVGYISITSALNLNSMNSSISTNASNISSNDDDIASNSTAISNNADAIIANGLDIDANTTLANTKLPKSGGTMTGLISMGNNSISNVNRLELNTNSTASSPSIYASTDPDTGINMHLSGVSIVSDGNEKALFGNDIEFQDTLNMNGNRIEGVSEVRYNNTNGYRLLYDSYSPGTGDPDNYTNYTPQDGDIWFEY